MRNCCYRSVTRSHCWSWSREHFRIFISPYRDFSRLQNGQVLVKGNEIRLREFGTFKQKKSAARMGRNPRTGEQLQISGSTSVGFSTASALKVKVQKLPHPINCENNCRNTNIYNAQRGFKMHIPSFAYHFGRRSLSYLSAPKPLCTHDVRRTDQMRVLLRRKSQWRRKPEFVWPFGSLISCHSWPFDSLISCHSSCTIMFMDWGYSQKKPKIFLF